MSKPLWEPSEKLKHNCQMQQFIDAVNSEFDLALKSYFELHEWSVKHPAEFWNCVWEFTNVIGNKSQATIFKSIDMEHTQWFQGATLNFAENCLHRRDDHTALYFYNESGQQRSLSYKQLYKQVAQLAAYLKSLNIKPGDRIAGIMPNCPETVIAMLVAASIGAVWSSCSPDFGLDGMLDRFTQIQPKILFAVDGHVYAGKTHIHLEKISQLQQSLSDLQQTIVFPYIEQQPDLSALNNAILFQNALEEFSDVSECEFAALPFDHPLYILYSSGTTGKPKCMVHGAGGTLLQHKKELMLHVDLRNDESIFFYTTCGWMMWNWLVSSLSVGATVVLYDGSPVHPKTDVLIDLIDQAKINVFGVGAKYIETIAKAHLTPLKTHSLKSLRTILTTGSPLLPQSFDYVYSEVKPSVQLSSISGGSDIISCFALGNPLLPVYRGELQCIGLGMDVKIFDGELVCTSPFPSMPVYFWNDPDGKKYHDAYFAKYPNTWAHGDYAEITEHNGLIIHGRSDATLNPSGVRIGTAEIYNQVEKIVEVIDCLAVGQQIDNAEQIILFVVLRDDITLDKQLIEKIKQQIRSHTSPMHVPARIIQAPDLPRTVSGKLVEIAVKNILNGRPVKNTSALANPESLEFFKGVL